MDLKIELHVYIKPFDSIEFEKWIATQMSALRGAPDDDKERCFAEFQKRLEPKIREYLTVEAVIK